MIYVITDAIDDRLPERVSAAVRGGASTVQLRAKGASARDTLAMALRLGPICRLAGVRFIVNDRLDVALAAGADGVHLGPEDLPVDAARRLCPPGFVIGASAGTVEDAREQVKLGADYLGVGAIFEARPSKQNASAPRGVQVLSAVRSAVGVPIVAIGGIELENAALCVSAGADGVAVIRAAFGAGGPERIEAAVARLRAAVDEALDKR